MANLEAIKKNKAANTDSIIQYLSIQLFLRISSFSLQIRKRIFFFSTTLSFLIEREREENANFQLSNQYKRETWQVIFH